ncbi:hypothetical protein SAMN04488109_4613 [Chryseolinea serpens]|uniref:Uncharacterized protein n=1 Tax=Chryseolinea serpens TaxID=947013 RepID=A0A1M5UDD4_9BACT|nr:hypothetical protein SAMN04488109_4613 [Chryseolinea serpens]
MYRTRYILRALFLLLTVSLLYYLNKRTDLNLGAIAKFKYETLNKIQSDSLDSKNKLDVLIHETEKFNEQINEDSSRTLKVIYLLIGVVTLFMVSELIFTIIMKRAIVDKSQN